ncbi:hypothetical protein [Lysobacter gummosus]|uniref:hypothetical protein n=1 Tax=Lysobacter gummosus TaxID=262324 RepID=UPI003634E103
MAVAVFIPHPPGYGSGARPAFSPRVKPTPPAPPREARSGPSRRGGRGEPEPRKRQARHEPGLSLQR